VKGFDNPSAGALYQLQTRDTELVDRDAVDFAHLFASHQWLESRNTESLRG
jgi:hypothetical protein